jgi:hypothetical protein
LVLFFDFNSKQGDARAKEAASRQGAVHWRAVFEGSFAAE